MIKLEHVSKAYSAGIPAPVSYTHLDVYKRQIKKCLTLYNHMCIISFVETTHWPIAKW